MAMTLAEKRQRKTERVLAAARMAEANSEARAAINLDRCPRCTGHVHRNLSLTGWVQCDGFGSEGFRKDPNAKPCNWQGFTGE